MQKIGKSCMKEIEIEIEIDEYEPRIATQSEAGYIDIARHLF